MARTAKDIASYFPHEANASSGDTLTVLQGRYGNNGYAFWFKLLEKLTATDGHYLDLRNPVKWQLFIAKMGIDEITTVEILNLLVEMDAIDKDLWDSKLIWCENLVKNIADVYKNRRREIPQKPIITNSNAITTEDNAITTDGNTQSKVKKSKVKKSNKENIKRKFGEFDNVLLTDNEHRKLLDKFGEQEASKRIERLSSGIASKGYKYHSHYATILNWSRRDEQEAKGGTNRRDTTKLIDRKGYTRPEDY